jgi:DNA-binding NarL/FixJ family response regulator
MPKKKPEPAVKILLVDDHPAVREALTARINQNADLQVCGEAQSALEAMQLFADKKPDIVITDISLQKSDGIDLIKRILAHNDEAKILVWSMHSETLYAERALRSGAKGYITKEQATTQIISAIRQVLAGKLYLSPAMTELLLRRVGNNGIGTKDSPMDLLSDRELEVFRLIGEGVRNDEIAQRLHISIKTVETHRERLKRKLNLKDGTALIRQSALWVLENP